jgi:hypothetical protein
MTKNEKAITILSNMFPDSVILNLDWNPETPITQVHFFTNTHECSVTDFSLIPEKDKRDLKRSNQNDNDIVWIGDFRFSATNSA